MLLQNVAFSVLLNGKTKLSGDWINNGFPLPATIAYPLGENIFIIGRELSGYLKMVKIRVTGERTFVWMDAKYEKVPSTYSFYCRSQQTFSKYCFEGTSVGSTKYSVELAAVGTKN